MIAELFAVFLGGVLGSAHCVGMCGGFAMAIGASDLPLVPIVARQFIYSAGRVFTYVFLGALGGAAGQRLAMHSVGFFSVQQVFSVVAGLIMLFVGLSVLGLIPRRLIPAGGLIAPLFAQFLNARGRGGFFIAGLANGFLPCGLVYSFLALALASGSMSRGMLLMGCFGLGTVPAMVLIGCGSRLLTHARRVAIHRVAAVFVVLIGLVTIARGVPGVLGHHSHGELQRGGGIAPADPLCGSLGRTPGAGSTQGPTP